MHDATARPLWPGTRTVLSSVASALLGGVIKLLGNQKIAAHIFGYIWI